jgi:hypothetical protein
MDEHLKQQMQKYEEQMKTQRRYTNATSVTYIRL